MTEQELADLHRRFSGVLFNVAISITREFADAEEVVNDAFAKAWAQSAQYDSTRGSELGWLITITRSRAIDVVRSRTRRHRGDDRYESHFAAAADTWCVWGADESSFTETDELARSLSRALGTLPHEQREVLELAFLHDNSHRRVARQLGVPLGTVKTRARLGLRKMRAALTAQ